MKMLLKWPWISRCGDYLQQAELRIDGACRIMMMMMMMMMIGYAHKYLLELQIILIRDKVTKHIHAMSQLHK